MSYTRKILSRESLMGLLSSLSPTVPLGNSLPFFRTNFAPLMRDMESVISLVPSSPNWHQALLILQSRLTSGIRQFVEWKQKEFFPFTLESWRIYETTKLSTGDCVWERTVVWLSHICTQLNQERMRQEKWMCVLGPVLPLSLCYFVEKFTSLGTQRLLSGNCERKYHVEVKKTWENKTTQITCCTLCPIWSLNIFPFSAKEHLWPYTCNHP